MLLYFVKVSMIYICYSNENYQDSSQVKKQSTELLRLKITSV